MGDFDKPKRYDVAPAKAIARVEKALGFALPPLLRRLYAEVADGGFGPSYGIYSLERHPGASQEVSLLEAREQLAGPDWPAHLLPLCEWGDSIWSCLDCREDDGPIVTVAGEAPFVAMGHDLAGWLRAWLGGADLWAEMFEAAKPKKAKNPFTGELVEVPMQGKPRGTRWR